jgi:hypothetical protein
MQWSKGVITMAQDIDISGYVAFKDIAMTNRQIAQELCVWGDFITADTVGLLRKETTDCNDCPDIKGITQCETKQQTSS